MAGTQTLTVAAGSALDDHVESRSGPAPDHSDLVIDADSHIEDNDEIWEYLDAEFRDRRPHVLPVGRLISARPDRNYVWFVDGEIFPKLMGYGATCYGTPAITDFGKRKPISVGAQDLTDLMARL